MARALRSLLARLYRWSRHLVDRSLHPRRHRRAVAARLAAPMPRRILVLCHGNVCRSPYFAAALRRDLARALRVHIEVDSAGFVGPGRPVPEESLAASVDRGVTLDHCSKLVTRPMLDSSDLVIVMDTVQGERVRREFGVPGNRVLIAGDLDPAPIESRVIRDPWKQTLDVFSATFDRIDRCVSVLVDALAEKEH
jgi:protein-tyrosine-phosphatase